MNTILSLLELTSLTICEEHAYACCTLRACSVLRARDLNVWRLHLLVPLGRLYSAVVLCIVFYLCAFGPIRIYGGRFYLLWIRARWRGKRV